MPGTYPNYLPNTQDTSRDIPFRKDIANASDYNDHDREILSHQTELKKHDAGLIILNSMVDQPVLISSSPTFSNLTLSHFTNFPTTPSSFPVNAYEIVNKSYVDSIVIYTVYFLFSGVGGWDNVTFPIASVKKSNIMTIVQVDCTAIGSGSAALTFNIEERVWGSFNSAGTNITASPMVANKSGIEVTSFSHPSIAAHSALFLTTGTAAAVDTLDYIMGTIYYTI